MSGGIVLALCLGLLLGIAIAVLSVTTLCCSRRLLYVSILSFLTLYLFAFLCKLTARTAAHRAASSGNAA